MHVRGAYRIRYGMGPGTEVLLVDVCVVAWDMRVVIYSGNSFSACSNLFLIYILSLLVHLSSFSSALRRSTFGFLFTLSSLIRFT